MRGLVVADRLFAFLADDTIRALRVIARRGLT